MRNAHVCRQFNVGQLVDYARRENESVLKLYVRRRIRNANTFESM